MIWGMPDKMTEMTGGQALIRSIHREGVRVIFGLPRVQLYHALDPITEFPDLRFITTRHEQATTYMADGYARASGDVGAAMMVPGPGLQNASAGISNAYAASSPVLVISGQINRKDIGKGIGILHEINDQLEIVRPMIKWSARVLEAKDIPGAVHECFVQLRTGRPRPVEIEIPPETLADMAEIELMEPGKFPASPVDLLAVQKAVELLSCANRTVIWAGGGVHSSRAWQELLEVAEFMQAPVITTAEGKGAISDRHYACQLRLLQNAAGLGPCGHHRQLRPSGSLHLPLRYCPADRGRRPRGSGPGRSGAGGGCQQRGRQRGLFSGVQRRRKLLRIYRDPGWGHGGQRPRGWGRWRSGAYHQHI